MALFTYNTTQRENAAITFALNRYNSELPVGSTPLTADQFLTLIFGDTLLRFEHEFRMDKRNKIAQAYQNADSTKQTLVDAQLGVS